MEASFTNLRDLLSGKVRYNLNDLNDDLEQSGVGKPDNFVSISAIDSRVEELLSKRRLTDNVDPKTNEYIKSLESKVQEQDRTINELKTMVSTLYNNHTQHTVKINEHDVKLNNLDKYGEFLDVESDEYEKKKSWVAQILQQYVMDTPGQDNLPCDDFRKLVKQITTQTKCPVNETEVRGIMKTFGFICHKKNGNWVYNNLSFNPEFLGKQ